MLKDGLILKCIINFQQTWGSIYCLNMPEATDYITDIYIYIYSEDVEVKLSVGG